jgi:hypothetical protein
MAVANMSWESTRDLIDRWIAWLARRLQVAFITRLDGLLDRLYQRKDAIIPKLHCTMAHNSSNSGRPVPSARYR